MASHAKHGSKRSSYSKVGAMPMHEEKAEAEMKPMMKGMPKGTKKG